jgi:hypothetical protein
MNCHETKLKVAYASVAGDASAVLQHKHKQRQSMSLQLNEEHLKSVHEWYQ